MSQALEEPSERMASRRVQDDGIVEEMGFSPSGGQLIFTALHRPEAPAIGTVLICSPVQAEQLRNYRREVLLARALARLGFAVQRFHYRGAGNSDGSPAEATFETMLEDARSALGLLAARGDGPLVLVGTRLGASLAAVLARDVDAAALAMWEPVTNADRYFREIFRGRLVSELKHGEDRTARKPVEELERTGQLDILGYSIDRPLYESVVRRRTADDLERVPRHVLLVQIGGSAVLRNDYRTLMATWSDDGVSVETHRVDGSEPWWFGSAPENAGEEPDRAQELVEVTSGWLLRTVATSA